VFGLRRGFVFRTMRIAQPPHPNTSASTAENNCHWAGALSHSYGVIQVATACAAEYEHHRSRLYREGKW